MSDPVPVKTWRIAMEKSGGKAPLNPRASILLTGIDLRICARDKITSADAVRPKTARHIASPKYSDGCAKMAENPERTARERDTLSLHHNIYELTGHDDDLHHFFSRNGRFHFFIREGLLPQVVIRGIRWNKDPRLDLPIHLDGDLYRL